MSISFNPARFNMVASGEASYRSLAGLHAFYANRYAGACSGSGVAEKHAKAGRSGGLAGPLNEGPSR